jgi:hypothetical protein
MSDAIEVPRDYEPDEIKDKIIKAVDGMYVVAPILGK